MNLNLYIGQRIRDFRKSAGMNQTQLAERLETTKQTISRYEKGDRKAGQDTLFALCDIFAVSIDDFFPPTHSTPNSQPTADTPSQATDELVTAINDKVVQLTTPNKKSVLRFSSELLEQQKTVEHSTDTVEEQIATYYTYRVYERLSAGTGESYYEDGDYDVVYYDEDITHDIASWIWGDSMEPKYLNGEVALIKETGFDYDGAVYAVSWAGQTFIKKVYLEKDGYRLVSLNPKYAPLFAHKDEEPRIIGQVIGNFKPMER